MDARFCLAVTQMSLSEIMLYLVYSQIFRAGQNYELKYMGSL